MGCKWPKLETTTKVVPVNDSSNKSTIALHSDVRKQHNINLFYIPAKQSGLKVIDCSKKNTVELISTHKIPNQYSLQKINMEIVKKPITNDIIVEDYNIIMPNIINNQIKRKIYSSKENLRDSENVYLERIDSGTSTNHSFSLFNYDNQSDTTEDDVVSVSDDILIIDRMMNTLLTDVNDYVDIVDGDRQAFNNLFIKQRQNIINNPAYRTTIESWKPNSLEQLNIFLKTLSKGKSLIHCHWFIFYWITYNIKYDVVSLLNNNNNISDQSVEEVFHIRKGVSTGYSHLYKYLCDQLNLKCEEIIGYSKAYGFDEFLKKDHVWNVVEIDQHWYLIDSTWGSGYLNEQKTFEQQLNTFYFLTRPCQMIYYHLPKDEKWQLLQIPINMTQYIQMPKVYPIYFELNLELISPRDQAHIDLLPGKSYALVVIRTSIDVELLSSLKLHDKEIDGGHRIIYDVKKQLYRCYFAPTNIGKHKVQLFAKHMDSISDSYEHALDLTIDINELSLNSISYPKTWKNFYDLNLKLLSPINTHLIKVCDSVTYACVLIAAPNDVELIGSLTDSIGMKIEGGEKVYYDQEKGIWKCKFAPNKDGLFDAEIFARKKSETGNYPSVILFKIEASQIPLPPISYPKTTKHFYDFNLKILSPINTYYIKLCNGTTHSRIIIEAPKNIELIGNLQNNDGQKIEGGERIYYDQRKCLWICKFAPNTNGLFQANIFGKKKSTDGNYLSIVSFKIEASQIPSPSLSYPQTWQLFHDLNLKIKSPQNCSRILWSENSPYVEVLIRAPDNVQLSSIIQYNNKTIKNGSLAQYDSEKNFWQLLFAPECIGQHELFVFAKCMNEEKSECVLKFYLNVTKIYQIMKFPIVYDQFHATKCRIYEPLNGILKRGSTVSFHYAIPSAIDVNLQVDSKWIKTEGYQDSLLKQNVTIGSKDVIIYAKYDQNSNSNALVKYSVQ